MTNMFQQFKEMCRFGTIWSHTQIDKKTIGSDIIIKNVTIWYNLRGVPICKILSRTQKLK